MNKCLRNIGESRTQVMLTALGSVLVPGALWAANPTTASTAPAPALQFADLGGVQTWRAGGDTTVFVKNPAGQWYKVEMLETCMKLDTKKGVRFVTDLDPQTNQKSSAVVVDRHICRVTSLTKVDSPDVAK